MLKRIVGIGLTWGVIWAIAALLLTAATRLLDPDSIDPGEQWMALALFAPMGFFSGVAFALLRRDAADASWVRTLACGFLGTAIVQAALLGHGDAGLAANLQIALVFCVFGSLVALAWATLVCARTSSHRS